MTPHWHRRPVKTYLKVLFSADGAPPSRINDALAALGFEPTTGRHDWEYEWAGGAIDDILEFGDRIHAALAGTKCLFQMETI
jgi:hypothetical protein